MDVYYFRDFVLAWNLRHIRDVRRIVRGEGSEAFIANLRTLSCATPFCAWIIIGVFYYIISFFISYRVPRHSGDSFLKAVSLTLLLAMMSIHAAWNYVFFRAQNLFLSFFAFIPSPPAGHCFVCLPAPI